MKNITVLCPKSEFTSGQLLKLSSAGKVSFIESGAEGSLDKLIKCSKEADILAFSPSKINKTASKWLHEILEASPKVKGLAVDTIHADYVNDEYCREHGIRVFTVPDYTIEAKAEYMILLLLACTRRVFVNDWQAQQRKYPQELGCELAGKTLGIIGINAISERVVRLAQPFGVRILIWNETPFRMEGAERCSLNKVLVYSDMLIINLPETEANKKVLSKEKISILKQGAVVVNLSGRGLVDEKSMSEALNNEAVDQYIFETESIKSSPFDNIRRAVALKQLSGDTKESLKIKTDSWVISIANLAGKMSSFRSL